MVQRQERTILFGRISGAWLGVLRIGFGLIMLYEALWFGGWLPGHASQGNRVGALLSGGHVAWSFPYRDFPWAGPLPEPWTTGLFVMLAAASTLVICGTFYRPAALTVFATFSLVNLLDASIYLNHFYLECVVALLMTCVPADRRYALRWSDLRPTRRACRNRALDVPRWTLVLFRAQVFLVYFYAGIAKLNADWLQGEPLRRWLPHPSTASVLDPWLGSATMDSVRRWLGQESTIMAISYGGLLFDLSVGFLLLWRRTRLAAFLAAVIFHACNFLLFDIGAFPFLALLLTTVFFEPDWPDKWLQRIRRRGPATDPIPYPPPTGRAQTYVLPILGTWLLLQTLLPLRHFFIPGNVSWTEEGHRFSWHMKLRDKTPGRLLIEVASPQPSEQPEVRYRQVDAANGNVGWDQLPELVITYEPILGERVIFNPLAGATWSEAAARARHRWAVDCGTPLQLAQTRPLSAVLDELDRRIEAAAHSGVSEAAAARQTLREVQALRLTLDRAGPNELSDELMDARFRFQQALRRLTMYRPWRKWLLTALWQSTPFACQGAGAPDAPFMVVASPELLLPDDHACCRINRSACPDLGPILIDLDHLIPSHLRSLPDVIALHDYHGRPAMFWNYTHELHARQIDALAVSPLLQHTYVQHVAETWEQTYGLRPQVYVTSFVKLNQHPMQPIVDARVDLANVPRQRIGHHTWILPLRRADAQSAFAERTSIARRGGELK